MADVFISFATRDRKVAERLLSFFEAEAVSCFFAPRDLEGGSQWHEGLYSAIADCRTVVLLLSASSSRSQHVLREIDIAVEQRKPVLPIRIDRVSPSGGLGYLLRPFQFMQATKALDDLELRSLLVAARRLLGVSATEVPSQDCLEDPTASLYRQLLLAKDAHEIAVLSEQVKVRLEASPQDIELRMLSRQVSKVESAFVVLPRSRRMPMHAGAMASYAFVAMAGFGVVAYVLDAQKRPQMGEQPVGAPIPASPAQMSPSTALEAERLAGERAAAELAAAAEAARKAKSTPSPVPQVTPPRPPPEMAVAPTPPPETTAATAPPISYSPRVGMRTATETCSGNGSYARAVCMDEECSKPQFREQEDCRVVLARKRAREH